MDDIIERQLVPFLAELALNSSAALAVGERRMR